LGFGDPEDLIYLELNENKSVQNLTRLHLMERNFSVEKKQEKFVGSLSREVTTKMEKITEDLKKVENEMKNSLKKDDKTEL